MKKNTLKAFTLVEMLIVIVIIGILIAALMPRMQQAQGRARDVTRKNDLQQCQTALVSYFWDTGKYPGNDGAKLTELASVLKQWGLDAVPQDPLNAGENIYKYANVARINSGQWFILYTATEVQWSANYVQCNGHTITWDISDTSKFVPCRSIVVDSTCSFVRWGECHVGNGGKAYYVSYY